MILLYMSVSVYNRLSVEYAFDENVLDEIKTEYENKYTKAKDKTKLDSLKTTCKQQFTNCKTNIENDKITTDFDMIKRLIQKENIKNRPKNTLFVRFGKEQKPQQDYVDDRIESNAGILTSTLQSTANPSIVPGLSQIHNQLITLDVLKETPQESDEDYKQRLRIVLQENIFDVVNATYEQYMNKKSYTEPYTKLVFLKQSESIFSIPEVDSHKNEHKIILDTLNAFLKDSTTTIQQLNISPIRFKVPEIITKPNIDKYFNKEEEKPDFLSVFVIYALYKINYLGEKDFIEDETLTFLGPDDIKSFQIKYKMAHVPLIDTTDSYFDSNFEGKKGIELLQMLSTLTKMKKDDLKIFTKKPLNIQSDNGDEDAEAYDGPFTMNTAEPTGAFLKTTFKEIDGCTIKIKILSSTPPIKVSISQIKQGNTQEIKGIIYRVPSQGKDKTDEASLSTRNFLPSNPKEQTEFFYLDKLNVTKESILEHMKFQKLQINPEEYTKHMIRIFTSTKELEGFYTFCQTDFEKIITKESTNKEQQCVVELLLSKGTDFFINLNDRTRQSTYEIYNVIPIGINKKKVQHPDNSVEITDIQMVSGINEVDKEVLVISNKETKDSDNIQIQIQLMTDRTLQRMKSKRFLKKYRYKNKDIIVDKTKTFKYFKEEFFKKTKIPLNSEDFTFEYHDPDSSNDTPAEIFDDNNTINNSNIHNDDIIHLVDKSISQNNKLKSVKSQNDHDKDSNSSRKSDKFSDLTAELSSHINIDSIIDEMTVNFFTPDNKDNRKLLEDLIDKYIAWKQNTNDEREIKIVGTIMNEIVGLIGIPGIKAPYEYENTGPNGVINVYIKLKHKQTKPKKKEKKDVALYDCKQRAKNLRDGISELKTNITRKAKVQMAKFKLGGKRTNKKKKRNKRTRKKKKNRT